MKNRMCFYLDSAAQENTPAPEVRPFYLLNCTLYQTFYNILTLRLALHRCPILHFCILRKTPCTCTPASHWLWPSWSLEGMPWRTLSGWRNLLSLPRLWVSVIDWHGRCAYTAAYYDISIVPKIRKMTQ